MRPSGIWERREYFPVRPVSLMHPLSPVPAREDARPPGEKSVARSSGRAGAPRPPVTTPRAGPTLALAAVRPVDTLGAGRLTAGASALVAKTPLSAFAWCLVSLFRVGFHLSGGRRGAPSLPFARAFNCLSMTSVSSLS